MKAILIIFPILLFLSSCENSEPMMPSEVEPKLLSKLSFDEGTFNKEETKLLSHKLVSINNTEGLNNSSCLEVAYIGNESGTERVVKELSLSSPVAEATLSFYVKFEEGFQFVKGGKLHGFGPIEKITGGNPIVQKGWSARMMFKENGTVQPYLYHQGMKGKFGEGQKTSEPYFATNTLHLVSMYMKVNSPATASNGVYELWIDGQKAASMENIQFRSEEGVGTLINSILFSTFLGGNDPSWAPKDAEGNFVTQKAWFDNISIYQGKQLQK